MIKIFNYDISNNGICAFLITYVGYTILSNLLHYIYFYNNSITSLNKWKIQPNKIDNIGTFHFSLFGFSIKKNSAAPFHSLIGFINLFNVCLMALILTELTINDKTLMKFNEINQFGIINIVKYFFIAFIYENIVEYYWHRAMHLPVCYKNFHKYHHYYKYPEPFDDMYIHPIEAIGYYSILLSPPFLFNIHIYSFLIYMVVMGLWLVSH
jgi:sterol desaturase/sphingolipid hydroxylase (fatty acid hydroxylase superfamily)